MPQIAFAIRLTSVEIVGSGFVAAAKPWRQAFRLDCNFPRKLVGPVLFFAFIVARMAFWIGYRIHPLYRAFGMGATGYLNVGLLAFALWKAAGLGA